MKLRSSDIEHTTPATLSQFAAFGIVLKSMYPVSSLYYITNPAITHHLSTPNLLSDMVSNNPLCLQLRVQEHRNGRRDLNTCQRAFEEHSGFSKRHLHPSVLGKLDSCKKGALQSPRATVMFAIG